ncbi:MAG: U32 family peptidase [Lachnospiraceae bacterium]|nr:U32 family peptidase [Lachnospiraceae bacterium]
MSKITRKKPELLCPAKDLEVLKTAVDFGADAVYIGGESFSLRAKARNFSPEDMSEGIAYAHAHGARVHVTANILAHNRDLEQAADYFKELEKLRPDAVLIADPGMFALAKEHCPDLDLHISTQANNTNYGTFNFWYGMGAKRVVCARELSLEEIREIREHTPEDLEIEAFIHGAMCISYSGRCLLSNYFTGRDANHGECTHPCRWKYTLQEQTDDPYEFHYAVEEESRPGEYLPVFENERGTYIFNSRDLCMIEHIPELAAAGIDSLKIEGRMKTALYVAGVARTYRKAIDDWFEDEEKYRANMSWYQEEIRRCTYRRFTTGFYFGKPTEESMVYDSNTYVSDAVWLGIAEEVLAPRRPGETGPVRFMQRNKFSVGDKIEIMKPDGRDVPAMVLALYDEEWTPVDSAPHPKQKLYAVLDQQADQGDLLRAVT